jgi:hypothetical protein
MHASMHRARDLGQLGTTKTRTHVRRCGAEKSWRRTATSCYEEQELVRVPGMCHLRMLLLRANYVCHEKEAQLESKTGAVVQLD